MYAETYCLYIHAFRTSHTHRIQHTYHTYTHIAYSTHIYIHICISVKTNIPWQPILLQPTMISYHFGIPEDTK